MTPTTIEAPPARPASAWVGPVLIVGAVVLVQVIGGIVSAGGQSDGWYAALAKPAWTPPGWVFGPVWTVLYAAMAVAACLVWARRDTHDVRRPLLAFAVQLGLNLLWSVLFFGLKWPVAAFAEILLLGFLVATTLVLFRRVSRWAGYLLVPYLAWVTFAAGLNLGIAMLNR